MASLEGKVIAITGAGRGIGRATALLAAAEGAAVALNDAGFEVDGSGGSSAPIDAVAAEIAAAGGRVCATSGDMASDAGAEDFIRVALDQFGHIDGLVLGTGVRRDRPIWAMREADWDIGTAAFLRAYFLPTKFATLLFRQQRHGAIVMLTSDAGLGAPGRSGLAAASEGVVGLARTVARDVGRYGVTCNAVSAQADTRLFAASADAYRRGRDQIDPEEVAALPSPAPRGWADDGDPWAAENVAPLILFLLTEAASGINGQVLGARGGDIYLYSNPAIERSIHTWGSRFTLDQLMTLGPRSIGYGLEHPARAGAAGDPA